MYTYIYTQRYLFDDICTYIVIYNKVFLLGYNYMFL